MHAEYKINSIDDLWALELKIREGRRDRQHCFTLDYERANEQISGWLARGWLLNWSIIVNIDAETNAADFVAEWVTAHREELSGSHHTSKWREEYSRAFFVEFETHKYLIQLCAWDHACCLDVQALNKATGSDDYIVAGDCDGVSGLTQRLDAFLRWLNANEPNRNA